MLNLILQANPQAQGSSLSMWIMLALIFLVMWFFMIRPQRKQQKELEAMRNSLKKGAKAITARGIYGIVAEVDERTVLMKVDDNVKIRVDKTSIQKDMTDQANQANQAKK